MCELLAKQCDAAIAFQSNDALDTAIKECLTQLTSNEKGNAKIYYFLGNLYQTKSAINSEQKNLWQQNTNTEPYKIKAYNAYLTAQKYNNFSDWDLHFQIQTNTANILNFFGRHTEALSEYLVNFKILHSDAPYIAAFHKTHTLIHLTSMIQDQGIEDYYLFEAYKTLKALKQNINKYPDTKFTHQINNDYSFNKLLSYAKKKFLNKKNLEDLDIIIPKQKNVKAYKEWCLSHRLFVNLLNDLTTTAFAADRDFLQFPDYHSTCMIIPHLSTAFSAIKRDYCFARYMAFEGITNRYSKFEEKDLFLANTLDGTNFGGKIERLKTSLRIAFSVFDSIAVLLLRYFIPPENSVNTNYHVSFSRDFFKKYFSTSTNPYISSLYWVQYQINQPSDYIKNIRNALEHNWFRISEINTHCGTKDCNIDYSYYTTEEHLKKATLETLKLARNSLIYFTFAIAFEENLKNLENDELVWW